MTQTLLVVVLFVGAIATLPWLVRRVQQRRGFVSPLADAPSKVLSAVAIGPHQKIVTVEVGPENARALLVLGVTAQQITCLHVLPANSSQTLSPPDQSFSKAMTDAQMGARGTSNG